MAIRDAERYRFGPFVLDIDERELRRGDTPVPLPGKAFDLLLTLVGAAGRTVTKAELMSALWPDTTVEESNLTQTVFVLRKAIGEDTDEAGYIRTVPRYGYKFVLPVAAERNGTASSPSGSPKSFWLGAILMGAAVLGVLAVTGALFYYRAQRPSVDLAAYRYRPFAFTQGFEHSGAWSPDGKTIAFLQGDVWGLGTWNGGRLMVQPADGGTATDLGAQVDVPPIRWSHDGTRLYFKKNNDVYSVSSAGGQPQFVVHGTGINSNFDLSPDGKILAIWRSPTSGNGSVRGSIWISSPPGAKPYEYTPAPFAVPAGLCALTGFSPNGKLLYVSQTTGNGNQAETWLLPMPPGSGAPRRIFSKVPWSDCVEASWMPDSRRLVLSTNIAPRVTPALWLADTRNETLTKITDGSSSQTSPAVSPDGRRLLFTRVEEDSDILELPLDGSAPRKLLATGTMEYSPWWSPKGGEFAYITQRNGSEEIWLRSSPGDWERQVVTYRDFPAKLQHLSTPVISPDGSRMAYWVILRDPTRIGSLYVSPRAGGSPTWLAYGGMPSWSPDSASLAFMGHTEHRQGLLVMRLGSNEEPFAIPNAGCNPPLPVWSPSGEWIACETAAGPLLVSPDGKVRWTLPPLNAFVIAWSQDSRTLYGLHGEKGSWSLLAQDVRSGTIRKVADYGFDINPFAPLPVFDLGMSLSPDGKSFAVGNLKRQAAIWMLEGFPDK